MERDRRTDGVLSVENCVEANIQSSADGPTALQMASSPLSIPKEDQTHFRKFAQRRRVATTRASTDKTDLYSRPHLCRARTNGRTDKQTTNLSYCWSVC